MTEKNRGSRIKKTIDLKNLLLILGIIAAMVLVGVVIPSMVYKHRAADLAALKASQTSLKQNGKVVQVSYTNKGFEPKTVTLSVGSSVVWTNESDKQMWVASDPHPSHNGLPGLDEEGTDGNMQHHEEGYRNKTFWEKIGLFAVAEAHGTHTVYKYTFVTKGSWGYHNHLSPNDTGKVIVE
jgi:plastocyanin